MSAVPTASTRIGFLRRSARGLRARDDYRDATITGYVAVVEAERCRDHARVHVVVHGHRIAVDGVRIACRVLAGVQGDLRQLLARRAVLVKVSLREHRDPVGRRGGPEGKGPLQHAACATAAHPDAGAAPRALRGRLPHRTKAEHVGGHAGGDGEAGVHHRAQLPRQLPPAAVPVGLEPERLLNIRHARTGESARTPTTGKSGYAVDVLAAEPRVLDRAQARVQGELERVAAQTASDVGLSDARERGPALEDLHHARSGSNSGTYTSSHCSNTTRTCMPIFTSSGEQFTMLVVRRRPLCSSTSTMAIA